MKRFAFFLLPLFLSSCAIHTGMITPTASPGHDKSIEYIDVAVGYSKVFYLFGFGGLGKDALINEAKRNMYLSYRLKNGQAFENLTLDSRIFLFGPFVKMEAIVVADVVQRDSSIKVSYSKNYLDFISRNVATQKNGFLMNESVYCMNYGPQLAKVIRLNKNKATVFYVNEKGAVKVKNVKYDAIFKQAGAGDFEAASAFKIGDHVMFTDQMVSTAYGGSEGYIIGINAVGAIVKTLKDKVYVLFSEIKKDPNDFKR